MRVAPPTPHTLVVINSLEIGGPQKSLIGFLQRVDPMEHSISVLLLQGTHAGPFIDHLPTHVNVLDSPPAYRAATLPKGELIRSLVTLLGVVGPLRLSKAATSALMSIILREPRTQLRQRFWRSVATRLPRIPGHFDAAIGILGQSTYAVLDLATARHRYHWIRSDSRMLGRHQHIEREYFSKLAGAVAVSPTCADAFQAMYPTICNRVRVYKNDIPNYVSSTTGQEVRLANSRALRLLTIGRLDDLKGVDLAIETCKLLVERDYDVRWDILGDGDNRVKYARRIEELDLREHIHLQGNVLNTDQYMTNAVVYVHPSRGEGRSNAVEEARASEIPIVACNYATVEDQVEHGVTGLISPFEAGALATIIGRLLDDRALRARLATAAATQYQAERNDPNALLDAMIVGTL